MGFLWDLPSGKLTVCYWTWPFIVDFPIKNGGSFHSYVSLPEGNSNFTWVYGRYNIPILHGGYKPTNITGGAPPSINPSWKSPSMW